MALKCSTDGGAKLPRYNEGAGYMSRSQLIAVISGWHRLRADSCHGDSVEAACV